MGRWIGLTLVLGNVALIVVGAIMITRAGPDTAGEWVLGIGVVGIIVQGLWSVIHRR
jgi:hypothetical protein